MPVQKLKRTRLWAVVLAVAPIWMMASARPAGAQSAGQPWMNSSLAPEERAELVLKQMTLEEKIALLHGNGMAHADQWQMPLTRMANGGAGYVEGVERLGIPPLF